MYRIIFISDTHTLHRKMLYGVESLVDSTKNNILIHAGDLTSSGKENEVADFIYWYQNLKGFDTKIFIAGNHDLSFESKPDWLKNYINDENLFQSDCVYLEDSEFIIEDPEFSKPIKFYGTPWQPEFCNWAFNVQRDKLYIHWEKIPLDTDILISHGPPHGILDKVIGRNDSLGCESLYEHVNKINPKIHVFGHIHDGRAAIEKNETLFINASICTEQYKPTNKPFVFDLREIDGKVVTDYIYGL